MLVKRGACIVAALATLMSAAPARAFTPGEDSYSAVTGLSEGDVQYRSVAADVAAELELDAAAVVLMERETGEILYEEDADKLRPIASITKVMTMILVMEAIEAGRISAEDQVVTSEHAYSMGGSQIWLEPGEIMTVDELLRAVAVQSANDAAVALAEHVSGSEEVFVAEMNGRAAELGMTNTVFKNANGLDEDGHLSTARDVAIMSRECLRHDLVRKYVTIWQDELRGGETELTNTNKMLRTFEGITGLKTGTTSKAGVCITASARRDDMELIAVVLGSSSSNARFAAAREMLEYGFAHFELADIGLNPADITPVRVKLGVEQYCKYLCEVPENVVVERGKGGTVSYDVEMAETQTAPVEAGQLLGEVVVYSEGIVIGRYPITATDGVERLDFSSSFDMLLRALASI
jgi:D-alanyl-D-alanine carboxypeptidase (penicillin-binding protein 5/6)